MNCRVDGSIAETYTAHHEGETSGFCGAIADHVQLETHASGEHEKRHLDCLQSLSAFQVMSDRLAEIQGMYTTAILTAIVYHVQNPLYTNRNHMRNHFWAWIFRSHYIEVRLSARRR